MLIKVSFENKTKEEPAASTTRKKASDGVTVLSHHESSLGHITDFIDKRITKF